MFRTLSALVVILLLTSTLASAPTEILILIHSQDSNYHRELGAQLRNDIISQSQALTHSNYIINVRLVYEIFNRHPGDWTILNVLSQLHTRGVNESSSSKGLLMDTHTKWIIWCEEGTHVELKPLLEALAKENHTQPLYMGHALYDQEATIIHHFAYFENPKWFPYPLLRAGVIFSRALVKSLTKVMTNGAARQQRPTDFSIDAAHELARFIYGNVPIYSTPGGTESSDGSNAHKRFAATDDANVKNLQKVILRKVPYVCPLAIRAHKSNNKAPLLRCAMYARPLDTRACDLVKRENLYFAVKTCKKYHHERLPILKATWAPYAKHLRYYSDSAVDDIPTTSCGIPNVEQGHCAKTLAILKLALEHIEQLNRHTAAAQAIGWLVLCDDDTLLSVGSLCQLLGCYNHTADIYLGERYGYRLHATDGFNYITGGGGIVLSLPTVRRVIQHCNCPSATAPDDMILGACLHSLQVPALHSMRFHQARPSDYAAELLAVEPPVSFHKFWQLDPLRVYAEYFALLDRQMFKGDVLKAEAAALKTATSSANASQKPVNAGRDCEQRMAGDECDTESQFTLLQHAEDKHFEF